MSEETKKNPVAKSNKPPKKTTVKGIKKIIDPEQNNDDNIVEIIINENPNVTVDEIIIDKETGEKWKRMIPPFDKSYLVSNKGRVKNIRKNTIKAQQISHTGYSSICFDNSINKKTYDMHRIVAQLFIGQCPDGYYVNHKDGNKTNNMIDNLEYLSPGQNTKHARDNNLVNKPSASVKVDLSKIESTLIAPDNIYCMDKKGNVYRKDTGLHIKPHAEPTGYVRFTITNKDGNRDHFYQHRMMAQLFIPNPKNLPQVNHINANKHDNRLENLEWCTASENMIHDAKVRQTSRKVQQINDKDEVIETFDSIKEASKKTNISDTQIVHVCAGRRITAGKFKWKYVDNESAGTKPDDTSVIKTINQSKVLSTTS